MSGNQTQPSLESVLDEIFVVIPQFSRHLRTMGGHLLEGCSLTKAHMSVLSGLHFAGPQTMTELSKLQAIAKPNLTVLVDKLESLGLVNRQNDPADRRVVRLQLTTKGEAQLEEYRGAVRQVARRGLQAYSAQEIVDLHTALASLRLLMERHVFKEENP
ncbi:MAG: MarR family transcriptional regulator [Spirochaetales bacterium]